MDPTTTDDGVLTGKKASVGGGGKPSAAAPPPFPPPPPPPPPPDPPGAWRSYTAVVSGLIRFLVVGVVGVVLMLGGLLWDGVSHARDPDAGHAETSVFNLSNPAHVVLLLGGALATVALVGAAVKAFSLSSGRRLSSPRTGAVLVVGTLVMAGLTAGTLQWASSVEIPIATGPLAPNPGSDPHRIGIVNSHSSGPCRATAAEKAAAARLIADTEFATLKYRSLLAALADGYVGPVDFKVTEHWTNPVYAQDGKVLDPTRPESLMYAPTPTGPVLVGVMYLTNIPGEFGPEPGGCLTRWHVHANLCYLPGAAVPATELQAGQTCPLGQVRIIPPPALHVWFYDVPGGRFAAEVAAEDVAKAVAKRS